MYFYVVFYVKDVLKFDKNIDDEIIWFVDKYILCSFFDESEDKDLYELVIFL